MSGQVNKQTRIVGRPNVTRAQTVTLMAICSMSGNPIIRPDAPTDSATRTPINVPISRPQMESNVSPILSWDTTNASMGAQTGC
jgi:hypothetical protein